MTGCDGYYDLLELDPPDAARLDEVRAEYMAMPGLNLTKRQFCRLWGLDRDTCDRVLEVLEATGFLQRTDEGGYVLPRA
jgi:DNA-binding IclR family transcriptional regulator